MKNKYKNRSVFHRSIFLIKIKQKIFKKMSENEFNKDLFKIDYNDSIRQDEYSFSVETAYIDSFKRLEMAKKVNLFPSLFLIIAGLIGHSLTIVVFAQKRFRKNSANVFLICLAVNDALYLIMHFFEDSVKTFFVLYLNSSGVNIFMNHLNITDKYVCVCRLINYMRYVIRFVSAYTIVAFSIQRLTLVFSPISNIFKSKRSAWSTFLFIVVASLIFNGWVIFIFGLEKDGKETHCDVATNWPISYNTITTIYILITMLIPILIIFICNLLIILNLFNIIPSCNKKRSDEITLRKCLPAATVLETAMISTITNYNNTSKKTVTYQLTVVSETSKKSSKDVRLKPFYLNINQFINKNTSKANSSKKITIILVLISFSYVFWNLPYLITWCLFYKNEFFDWNNKLASFNNLHSILKIVEIFYLLNYSLNFYIYCAAGSVFRNQLKYSCNFIFIF